MEKAANRNKRFLSKTDVLGPKTDRGEAEHATGGFCRKPQKTLFSDVFTGGAKNKIKILFLHKNKIVFLFFVSVFFDIS